MCTRFAWGAGGATGGRGGWPPAWLPRAPSPISRSHLAPLLVRPASLTVWRWPPLTCVRPGFPEGSLTVPSQPLRTALLVAGEAPERDMFRASHLSTENRSTAPRAPLPFEGRVARQDDGVLKRWRTRGLGRSRSSQRPAAWGLLIGGLVTFISVITGLVVLGDDKLATLLVAADLIVSGFSAVQESEDDD